MTEKINFDRILEILADATMGSKLSVYCDTGPVVSIIMGEVDPFFDDAVRFFNAVKSSGARLVISSLLLSEAVDVMRKRIKERHKCTDVSGRERESIEVEVAMATAELADFIDELKCDKKVDILEEEFTVHPDLAQLYEKLLECAGRTPQARKGNRYRHVGIGPVDWIHIALAHLVGALAICTTDKAFAQISGDKQYGGMEIITLQPR